MSAERDRSAWKANTSAASVFASFGTTPSVAESLVQHAAVPQNAGPAILSHLFHERTPGLARRFMRYELNQRKTGFAKAGIFDLNVNAGASMGDDWSGRGNFKEDALDNGENRGAGSLRRRASCKSQIPGRTQACCHACDRRRPAFAVHRGLQPLPSGRVRHWEKTCRRRIQASFRRYGGESRARRFAVRSAPGRLGGRAAGPPSRACRRSGEEI